MTVQKKLFDLSLPEAINEFSGIYCVEPAAVEYLIKVAIAKVVGAVGEAVIRNDNTVMVVYESKDGLYRYETRWLDHKKRKKMLAILHDFLMAASNGSYYTKMLRYLNGMGVIYGEIRSVERGVATVDIYKPEGFGILERTKGTLFTTWKEDSCRFDRVFGNYTPGKRLAFVLSRKDPVKLDEQGTVIVRLSRCNPSIYQGICNSIAKKVFDLVGVRYRFWIKSVNWSTGAVSVQTNIEPSERVVEMVTERFSVEGATPKFSIRPKFANKENDG